MIAAPTGPIPVISVVVVPDASTAAVIRFLGLGHSGVEPGDVADEFVCDQHPVSGGFDNRARPAQQRGRLDTVIL